MPFNFKFLIILVISFFLKTGLAYADESIVVDLQKSYDKLKLDFDKSIKDVPAFAQNLDLLDKKQKEFSSLNIKLEECITENTEKLSTSKGNLKLLGEKENTEDRDVKTQRADLEKQIQDIDNELKRCNLLKIQLKEISEETTEKRSVALKQKLLSKEISLLSSITKGPFSIDALKPTFSRIFQNVLTLEVLLSILAGLGVGWLLKRQNPIEPIEASRFSSPTLASIFRGIRRTAPVLIPLLFVWVLLKLQPSETSALEEPLGFALILTFVFALARGIIFPQPNNIAENNIPRFKLLVLIYLTILFSTLAYALNEPALGRFTNSNVLYLIWLASMVIAALSFICTLYISIKCLFHDKSHSFYLYIPMTVLVCLIFTAVLGYRNLSSLLFFGLTLSLTTIFLMFLVIRVSSEFFDSLDEGKIQWQSKLRKLMSVKSSQAFPGVIWFRILVFFAVLFLGISALLSIWGGPQQPITSLKGVFQNGLNIGSLNFDVFNIIYALLVMIVTLSVLPYIKNKLILGWLKHSNLSSGAKDATQTLIGYVVLAIATLWALFILGMNFQNLAIIAGALSVGIGFGLQNIVNNFVSGLILLFERPIRRGDWIAVGNTEGYVRDISIRSTTIQTFDKADVIVPNSELISNQVTNWMLSSNIGRLKAAVGVAYGSDVNKVMDILKQIANDHPEVISNNEAYATNVFLLNFGDSSLDFELRCFIRNIDSLVRIKSEINLSIEAAFRENNIEIPFPQRVINNITEKEDKIVSSD